MTMIRILTTVLQIFLVGGALILSRMMYHELKQDIKQTIKDFRK